jgi:hypothetical protein
LWLRPIFKSLLDLVKYENWDSGQCAALPPHEILAVLLI